MARGSVIDSLFGRVASALESKVAAFWQRHLPTIMTFVIAYAAGVVLATAGVLPWLTYRGAVGYALLAVMGRWGFRWSRWCLARRRLSAELDLPSPPWHRLLRDGWTFRRKLGRIRTQWDVYCSTHKLKGDGGVTPQLRKIRTTIDGDLIARVSPGRIGVVGGVEKLKVSGRAIAEVCACPGGVTVKPLMIGTCDVKFQWHSTLDRVHPIKTYRRAPGRNRVGYGVRDDGSVASFDGLNHILICGMTGSGKSGALWAALTSITEQGIRCRGYLSDIKRVELKGYADKVTAEPTDAPMHVVDYANDVTGTIRLIDKVEREVKARQSVFPHRQWTFDHAAEWPMVLLGFDEMVQFMKTMKATPATNVNKQTLLRLETIAAEGRALGIYIWGLTQLAQKEVMGDIRDMIPQQLCLSQKNRSNVDVVLGDGAAKNGAPAHTIRDKPGYGYSAAENLPDFQPFRAWWCDQTDVDRITRGLLPFGVGSAITAEEERDCSTYVFWAQNGMCLYVGEGYRPEVDRWPDHAGEKGRPAKPWWPYVDHSKTQPPVPRGSKAAALAAEKELIHRLLPIGNDQHNRNNPWRGRYDLLELPSAPQKPRRLPFRPKIVTPTPAKDPEQTWPVLPQTELEFFDQETAPILFPPDAQIVPITAGRRR